MNGTRGPAHTTRTVVVLVALAVLGAILLPQISKAETPGYITISFGRTQYVSIDGASCQPFPNAVNLDQVAEDMSARGLTGVGNVIVNRTPESGLFCARDALSLQPSWDWMSQRQAAGWRFISGGADYLNMTTLTPTAQIQESCGSLAAFDAHDLVGANGMFAYPNDKSTTEIQNDPVSTCFDFGRKYGSGVSSEGGMAAPWFASTLSVNGGNCNDPTQPCYTFSAPRRYGSPQWLAAVMDVSQGSWLSIQFYRFVTGSRSGSHSQWDCSSPDWRQHWVSRSELYCYDDFLKIMDAAQAAVAGGAVVTDPHTVARAWGRATSPSPSPSPSPRRPDGLLALGGPFIGNDVYNSTGLDQAITNVAVPRGTSVTFSWQVENDGTLWDQVTLTGQGSSSNLWVRFTVGTSNVTGMIAAGTYARWIAPGVSFTVSLRITAGMNAQPGLTKTELLAVISLDQSMLDAVLASVIVE